MWQKKLELEFVFRAVKVISSSGVRSPCSIQSYYEEVPRWEIFMEQELRFGLDLGQMANLPS